MINLVFIRHGQTLGNTQKRYIGKTDQPILEQSATRLSQKRYPYADIVYTTPFIRCQQTVKIIYPHRNPIIIQDFSECDFGKFEGKNFTDLSGDAEYQAWIDSNGMAPFPQGETLVAFKKRCISAFLESIEAYTDQKITIAFIVHGGTIMAIFEHFSKNKKSYYDWQVENESGYKAIWKKNQICEVEKIC